MTAESPKRSTAPLTDAEIAALTFQYGVWERLNDAITMDDPIEKIDERSAAWAAISEAAVAAAPRLLAERAALKEREARALDSRQVEAFITRLSDDDRATFNALVEIARNGAAADARARVAALEGELDQAAFREHALRAHIDALNAQHATTVTTAGGANDALLASPEGDQTIPTSDGM